MGTRGPVPLRSEERVGHPTGKKEDVAVTAGALLPVKWPAASRDWSPRAKRLWRAARDSGQSAFYQQSDVERLAFLLDQVTYFEGQPQRSAMMLQVITSELSNLLFSEADRRRVRIELSRPDSSVDDAQVTAIANYRSALGVE